VLALDDGAIARVLIGATRFAADADRIALLERFAATADPARPRADRVRIADRRTAGRERWRRWAALRRAGRALASVPYDGAGLAKLIVAGWLPRRESDLYRPEDVARAIADLLDRADLPKKPLTR